MLKTRMLIFVLALAKYAISPYLCLLHVFYSCDTYLATACSR
jgi:hypothetical protein